MTFKKGQSGNPAGRPPGPPSQQIVLKQMCQEGTPRAIDILKEIIEDRTYETPARIAAIKLLLQYGYGLPVKQVEIKDNRQGRENLSNMKSADILDMIDKDGVYEVVEDEPSK